MSRAWQRAGWVALGTLLMIAAVISVPLPIPTTPIVIASLLAFAKASDRLRDALLRHADRMAVSSHALVRRLAGLIRAAFPV
jgi:uncharacterized membrane protein YbaN (DUF454 family)